MLPSRSVVRGLAGALACALVLGACVGSSPPSRFYALTPLEAPAAPPPPSELSVAVVLADFPGLLDRPQLVLRRGEHERVVLEQERWIEPLQDAVPRVLAASLARLLGTDRVVHARGGAAGADLVVTVRLDRFDAAVDAGPAVLAARWRIDGASGAALSSRAHRFEARPASADAVAVVAALDHLLGELSRAIAEDVVAAAPAS